MSRPSSARWNAALHLEPGSAFYCGTIVTTGMHRHHALQVCVGGNAEFRLRQGTQHRWVDFDAAVVGAEIAHQFDGGGSLHAMLYLDPECGAGKRALPGAGSGITPFGHVRLQDFRQRMLSVASGGFEPIAVRSLHDELRTMAGRDGLARRSLDPRIESLLESMRKDPAARWSLEEAAAALGLSPGRARHLFASEVGTTLRRFRRWIRLEAALRTIAVGETLTTAAHAAGFADSAHLSRAFREMFGLTPSSVMGVARILVGTGMPAAASQESLARVST